jgi:radical SAM superfamily enzyme YgiQ (UPF0313 family)
LGRPRDRARLLIEERLEAEHGTLGLDRPAPVCMVYPSPYRVGMSALGFQTLYRILNEAGPGAHRAFLPDAWEPASLRWPAPKESILSYEQRRPVSDYRILAMSVSYELEITGVIRLLEGAGIPLYAKDRGPRDPILIAGGPLTTTNPSMLLPFVDILMFGEGEEQLPLAVDKILSHRQRSTAIEAVAAMPHAIRGELEPGHFEDFPTQAKVDKRELPAFSAITTPNTELADMFLVEPERGCSRQCTFCVMRGPSTGGMRLLDMETPLGLVPDTAKRVGLVGAAVTDHPKLEALIDRVVQTGRGVGVSSLRADRLTPDLVANLARGGYRQITVASDGISQRLRDQLQRRIKGESILRAADLVRDDPTVRGLKVYNMIGVPTETDEDVDELIDFNLEIAKKVRLTLTFSTFVAKRNTPLDGQPFIGTKEAEARLKKIRKGLGGKVQIRPQSPKWAHVEYLLAQRGAESGYAAVKAVYDGGGYRAWLKAFESLEPLPRPLVFGDEALKARRARRAAEREARARLTVLP